MLYYINQIDTSFDNWGAQFTLNGDYIVFQYKYKSDVYIEYQLGILILEKRYI